MRANAETSIPAADYSFSSDRAGVEHVVAVASAEPLPLDVDQYAADKGYYSVGKALAETQLKTIRIRANEQNDNSPVVREVDLVVGNSQQGRPTSIAKPLVFVTTDKPSYAVGETMTIGYGADLEGYIYLVLVNPDGSKELIKEEKVMKNAMSHFQARTEEPVGQHAFVALYSVTKLKKNATNKMLKGADGLAKGITVIEKDKPTETYAVHPFDIE